MCLVDGNRQPSEFECKVPRSDVALRDFVDFVIPEHGMSIEKVMAFCIAFQLVAAQNVL